MTNFDIADLIARVTERTTHDPLYWQSVGVPMPAKFLVDSIEIPVFLSHWNFPPIVPDLTRIGHGEQ